MQDIDSYEQMQETVALLKILALGNRRIEAGQVQPTADVITRLRERPQEGVQQPVRVSRAQELYPTELLDIGIREYRETFFSPCRIIYRVMENDAYVLVIADGRGDVQTLLQRRFLGV